MLKDTYKALNDHKTQKNIISAKKYNMYWLKLEQISKILDSVGMCNTMNNRIKNADSMPND